MRVNTRKVIDAWLADREYHKSNSLWTNGREIYSYNTCIVFAGPNNELYFNATKYSHTTTIYQNQIRNAFGIREDGYCELWADHITILHNVNRGMWNLFAWNKYRNVA